jgi:putative restriction endonuclease
MYRTAGDWKNSHDEPIRAAVFNHIRRLNETRDHLTSDDLKAGVLFEGARIPLLNPQRGIFKPTKMQRLLSIRTVFPKKGGRVWYDDQRTVHAKLFEGDDAVDYSFMGTDAAAAENRWLREAMEDRVPIIYFLGIAPGLYKAICPAFIAGWDRASLQAKVVFAEPGRYEAQMPETSSDRRYALALVQRRLHQASFREAVMAAYGGRCALSGLPNPCY